MSRSRSRKACLSLTRLPRAARPPEAAISALGSSSRSCLARARSWPAFLHHWHRVARADCVTLVLGAVCNPHAWRNAWLKALRGGACRNAGQGNPGGQDESGETHGGNLPLGRALTARTTIYSHIAGAHHCEVGHTGRFFCRASKPWGILPGIPRMTPELA